MALIFRAKGNPDGLDEIFEAYEELKAVYDAATPLASETDDPAAETLIRMPGSGHIVDTNDTNALNGLEYWLSERVARQVEDL